MSEYGDSTIICHTNTKNLIKNNEICCLKAEIIKILDSECSLDEEQGTIPLIFSPKYNGFDIIRADTGLKVFEFETTNVTYIKWFIPGKYLEDFNNFSQDQELGIITVDSNNILDFYPRIFNQIKFKNDIIGLFTSYFRDNITGNLKLAVLIVECDGNITRWVPFGSNSTISRNILKRQIKFTSDSNVIIELNNLKASIKGVNDNTNLGVLGTSDYMNKALELNRKLFLVSFDGDLCIMDSVNLGIIRIVNLGSQINSLYPFIDLNLNASLVVSGNSLSILDLDSLETIYEYYNKSGEFGINFNCLNTSEILNVKVDLLNPNIFIISSKCRRVYLLDILKNNLVNFLNISANKLYLYYYTSNDNDINNNNTRIKFGCIGIENYNLVSFDIFKLKLLYNKVSIPNNINIISNSQLQPNLLLTSSENSLIQFDIHYTHTSEYHEYNNNTDNNNSDNTNNNNINNENEDEKVKNGEEREDKEEYIIEKNKTISRILTNNLIGIKKYKNIIKSEITCITFHPRLPNVSSVGCKDGSLFLFFLEFENVDLFEFILVHKFNSPIKGLIWHLVPGGLNEEPNLNKKNFLQRVWKSIYSSKYTSILLIQLDEIEINSKNSIDMTYVFNGNNNSNINRNNNINRSNRDYTNGINKDDINSIYLMKLVEKPRVYKILTNKDEEFTINKFKLFSIFIIQYPPTFDTGSYESNDFTDQDDLTTKYDNDQNNKRIKYNNFSLICDHICLVYYTTNWILLRLFWMDWNLNIHLVKRFRIKVKGDITNIILTHKQYNQYLLYNNMNDSDDNEEEDIINNQCLDKLLVEQEFEKMDDEPDDQDIDEEDYLEEEDELQNENDENIENKDEQYKKEEKEEGMERENENTNTNVEKNNKTHNTNNHNTNNIIQYYDIEDDPEYKLLTCINPLQQYLIISTNSGYIYITTLVRMYNNISLITNSINGISGYLSISEEHLLTDEISIIHNNNISHLKYTILHSFHSPLPRKSFDGCLCSNSCYFILAFGLYNLILLYKLIFDHNSNKFKLILLHYKKCNYNDFILISEPYNYFKLLINSDIGLLSYSFTL